MGRGHRGRTHRGCDGAGRTVHGGRAGHRRIGQDSGPGRRRASRPHRRPATAGTLRRGAGVEGRHLRRHDHRARFRDPGPRPRPAPRPRRGRRTLAGQRLHRLLLPPDFHQRRRNRRHRPDTRADRGRIPQLQDIHHQHPAAQRRYAGQQDRLRQARGHHGPDSPQQRHAAYPLRRRRHGALQLLPRPGQRPVGLVEHAPHSFQRVGGRLLPPRLAPRRAERLARLLRPRQRPRGRGSHPRGPRKGNGHLRARRCTTTPASTPTTTAKTTA